MKKFILALLLPILGFFSFPARESPPPALSEARTEAQAPSVPQPTMPPGAPARSGAPAVVNGEALKECLAKPSGRSGPCLDAMFREFLKTRTTAEALAAVQQFEATDSYLRLSCHPVVHAIGRETLRLKGTVHGSFTACDQTCHSGCYHGAMERFLWGDAADDDALGHISPEELNAKAAQACDLSQPTRFRFQCLHGLGHALLFFSDYRLEEALSACDGLPDSWSRSSCYGGLFMENVFASVPAKRDLDPTDSHYPCSKLDSKYRSDCYMMQTTRMSEMGLSTAELFAECRKAGAYQYICMQSIGRDLSNDARIKEPRLTSVRCELGQGSPAQISQGETWAGEERRACIRGVVYALIDNTWDGRYAFPFCATFPHNEDAGYCFSASSSYLSGTFEKSPGEILRECKERLLEPQPCLAAISR